MLAILDRHLKFWHVCLIDGITLAWFVGMLMATQSNLPGAKLFRCPIGLCFGYYSPAELQATLTRIGANGREFLAGTLLPLDMVLPALVLVALIVTYSWFTRPGEPLAVPLSAGTRYAFFCVPLCYCLVDYAENWALAECLDAFPNLTYRLARRASFLTAAKSQLVVAAVGIAIALIVVGLGTAYRSGDGTERPPRQSP
jgi:hypothetical protein